VQRNVAVADRARFAAHATLEVEKRVRAEQRAAHYRRLAQSREEEEYATTILISFTVGALLGLGAWRVMLGAIVLAGGVLFGVALVQAWREYSQREES
jgi:hypothetical protein